MELHSFQQTVIVCYFYRTTCIRTSSTLWKSPKPRKKSRVPLHPHKPLRQWKIMDKHSLQNKPFWLLELGRLLCKTQHENMSSKENSCNDNQRIRCGWKFEPSSWRRYHEKTIDTGFHNTMLQGSAPPMRDAQKLRLNCKEVSFLRYKFSHFHFYTDKVSFILLYLTFNVLFTPSC